VTGDRFAIGDSPAEIWLEPQCTAESVDGRTWESSPLCDCVDCGSPAVRYVREDLTSTNEAALIAELGRRRQQVAALLDIAEAAKALLGVLSNPSPGHMQDRIAAERRLRATLAATANVPKADPKCAT